MEFDRSSVVSERAPPPPMFSFEGLSEKLQLFLATKVEDADFHTTFQPTTTSFPTAVRVAQLPTPTPKTLARSSIGSDPATTRKASRTRHKKQEKKSSRRRSKLAQFLLGSANESRAEEDEEDEDESQLQPTANANESKNENEPETGVETEEEEEAPSRLEAFLKSTTEDAEETERETETETEISYETGDTEEEGEEVENSEEPSRRKSKLAAFLEESKSNELPQSKVDEVEAFVGEMQEEAKVSLVSSLHRKEDVEVDKEFLQTRREKRGKSKVRRRRRKKVGSASTFMLEEEPEFSQIHQVGLLRWRVFKGQREYETMPVEERFFGEFYAQDCYIISSTKLRRDGRKRHDVHLWLGSAADEHIKSAALSKLLKFYLVLEGNAVLYREHEFHESQMLQSYFNLVGMTHHRKAYRSGYAYVDQDGRDAFARLYAVKQNPKCFHSYEIDLAVENIEETGAYILDLGNQVYSYRGPRSTIRARFAAQVALNRTARSRNTHTPTQIIDHNAFCELLASRQKDSPEEAGDMTFPNEAFRDAESTKVFSVSMSRTLVRFKKVERKRSSKEVELGAKDMYFVQSNNETVAWLGFECEHNVRSPFHLADKFASLRPECAKKTAIMVQQSIDDSFLLARMIQK